MSKELPSLQVLYKEMREKIAVRFFALCFEVSDTFNRKRVYEAITQFIAFYYAKDKEFADLVTEHTSKAEDQFVNYHQDETEPIMKAVKDALRKEPFVHFLSQNCEAIFFQGRYQGFRCSPQIVCRAIITTKGLCWTGNQPSAEMLLRIIIVSHQKREFKLSDKDASELYRIAGQVSIALNHSTQAHIRLHSAISHYQTNYKAVTLLLTQKLRNFSFEECYYILYEKTNLFGHQKFKAIRYFTAACIDPTENEEFINIMQEDRTISQFNKEGRWSFQEKYYRFDHCCGYFLYLTFEPKAAYSYLKYWFDVISDVVSIEGMCLCSYRQKDYGRALDQIDQMRHLMPYESGWKLTIAAVCYFKLGDEKKATAMLGKVNEASLTFEEDVFYCGVLCLVGQQEKAIKRLSALPQHANSILNTQRAIVLLLCEQRQGNTAQANRILESLPYLEQNEQSIDHRYMEFQQALFLANYCFERNRFAEGRHYVKKVRRMGESLRKIARTQAVQRLMEEFNEQRQVEVELIFR